ncbi:MAG: hypothetical protein GTO14_03475 [Anaerolineales bacterium]|nr:hypothetical protein [Anaerolineales bacterium]
MAGFAEENEIAGAHGLEMMDGEVFLGSAQQAGAFGYFARFDELARHLANPLTLPLPREAAPAFAQRYNCGTIYGNHSAPPGVSLGQSRVGVCSTFSARLAHRRSHRVV